MRCWLLLSSPCPQPLSFSALWLACGEQCCPAVPSLPQLRLRVTKLANHAPESEVMSPNSSSFKWLLSGICHNNESCRATCRRREALSMTWVQLSDKNIAIANMGGFLLLWKWWRSSGSAFPFWYLGFAECSHQGISDSSSLGLFRMHEL